MAHEELEQYLKQKNKKRPSNHEDRKDQSSLQKENDTNGQKKEVKCSRCGGDHQVDKCSVDKGVCFICKKPWHKLKDCLMAKGACFNCKRQGHLVANCPEKL